MNSFTNFSISLIDFSSWGKLSHFWNVAILTFFIYFCSENSIEWELFGMKLSQIFYVHHDERLKDQKSDFSDLTRFMKCHKLCNWEQFEVEASIICENSNMKFHEDSLNHIKFFRLFTQMFSLKILYFLLTLNLESPKSINRWCVVSRQDCIFFAKIFSPTKFLLFDQTKFFLKKMFGEIWNTCAIQTGLFDGNKLSLPLVFASDFESSHSLSACCLSLLTVESIRDEIDWSYLPSSLGQQSSSPCQEVSRSHEKLISISHRKAWSHFIFSSSSLKFSDSRLPVPDAISTHSSLMIQFYCFRIFLLASHLISSDPVNICS